MKQKLEWAEEFGATHVVDASKDDPMARVQALSGTGGIDYAFEVVGMQKTVEQALLSTHRGGTAVVVGVCPAGTRLSIDPLLFLQQRTLTGTSCGGGHQCADVPMLIELFMAGQYKLQELISRRLPLTELNHAFDLMLQGEVKRSVAGRRSSTRPTASRAIAERLAEVSAHGPADEPRVLHEHGAVEAETLAPLVHVLGLVSIGMKSSTGSPARRVMAKTAERERKTTRAVCARRERT